MRKVVNGLLYDTKNADFVEDFWNGLGNSDFRNLSEELYKSKNGKWFLVGRGGPLTKYSETVGNMRSGSKNLIPLSDDEAYEWLEEYSDVETILKYFPNKVKDA